MKSADGKYAGKKFAAFILTHGRPDRVKTLHSLRKYGYTGKVYLIIDNEDDTADEYFRRFGTDMVIQFDKKAISETFDTADLSEDRRTIVYARNACHEIANKLGLDYYIQLDDDYNTFGHRFIRNNQLIGRLGKNMDAVCEAFIQFLEDTDALTIAFGQGGDYIGGLDSGTNFQKGLLRKAMNSFFVRTDRPIGFVGRVNEDVNTYVTKGNRGELFFTAMKYYLVQAPTQSNEGGMTSTYLDSGTYVKSFYTVMMAPSCVKVGMMGSAAKRMHHQVNWRYAVPQIVSDRYKKKAK